MTALYELLNRKAWIDSRRQHTSAPRSYRLLVCKLPVDECDGSHTACSETGFNKFFCNWTWTLRERSFTASVACYIQPISSPTCRHKYELKAAAYPGRRQQVPGRLAGRADTASEIYDDGVDYDRNTATVSSLFPLTMKLTTIIPLPSCCWYRWLLLFLLMRSSLLTVVCSEK